MSFPALRMPPLMVLDVRSAAGSAQQVIVDGDEFLIGRGDFCDLILEDSAVPLVQSVIRVQQGAVWIEAEAEHRLLYVNGRQVPRLALRSGDMIKIGSATIRFFYGVDAHAAMETLAEIRRLTPVELCERIEAEETQIAAHERRRLTGMESLLAALENVLVDESGVQTDAARLEVVLRELHDLSDVLAARSQTLAACEQEFRAQTDDLHESHEQMTRRLDNLLHRLDEGELRASA